MRTPRDPQDYKLKVLRISLLGNRGYIPNVRNFLYKNRQISVIMGKSNHFT